MIDRRINRELESLRETIERFIRNPEPPVWIPPDYITDSSVRDFLTSLQIPMYQNGKPSLLFHNLSLCDDDQIEAIFGSFNHVYVLIVCSLTLLTMDNRYICNTSASGKTRRTMEGFTKYWGFYLVTLPDSNQCWCHRFKVRHGSSHLVSRMGTRPS
jgi:hypothetical protein